MCDINIYTVCVCALFLMSRVPFFEKIVTANVINSFLKLFKYPTDINHSNYLPHNVNNIFYLKTKGSCTDQQKFKEMLHLIIARVLA